MEQIKGINSSDYYYPRKAKTKKAPLIRKDIVESDLGMKKFSSSKTSELRAKMLLDDRRKLEAIWKYNYELRKPPERITLDRNPVFESNIPYQPNSYYRMIGENGFQDFLMTGLIRPKQNTKENYSEIYFEKGRANNIYSRNGGAMYILESSSKRIQEGEAHYPKADMLEKDKDPFRIWHRLPSGDYEIVYDTMNDIISRNPEFRYKVNDDAA